MKFPELDEHIAWTVICATFGLGIILIFFAIKDSQEYNHCKQAGGVFVAARHNYVCLHPDAVIEMKEVE